MTSPEINPAGDPLARTNRWIYRITLGFLVLLLLVNFGGAWAVVFIYHGMGFYHGPDPVSAPFWETVWRTATWVGGLALVTTFWYQLVKRLGDF